MSEDSMALILQIIMKALLVGVLLFFMFWVLTNEIDIRKTIIGPLTSLVKFKKHSKLEVDFANVLVARFVLKGSTQSGNLVVLFYDIKFVNSLEENVTVKQILLRYRFNGGDHAIDSTVVLTGTVDAPQGKSESIIVHRGALANLVFMGWKNLRSVIGEYKVLVPGGVLAGNAAFVLDIKSIEDLAKVKTFQMVAVDYSGNESVQEIPIQDQWIEMAKVMVFENRSFAIDQVGNIRYSN
jgi:hypothetical protein